MDKSPNPPLSPKISKYHDLLLKWSKRINLVVPSTLTEAKTRHFEDSLQILPLIDPSEPGKKKIVLDIGSGAGFPGMVIAVERPDLSVHLVESDTKKCLFLSTISSEPNTPALIHNQGIEAVGMLDDVVPDVITARALTSLTDLLVLTKRWWENHPQIMLAQHCRTRSPAAVPGTGRQAPGSGG